MRARIRVRRAVTGAVLAAVLPAGCASTPAEKLEDWWGSGGDRSMKALSQTSGRVNEVNTRPMDVWGEACQEASEGIREVQKGIGRLAAAMSLIRGDLEGR